MYPATMDAPDAVWRPDQDRDAGDASSGFGRGPVWRAINAAQKPARRPEACRFGHLKTETAADLVGVTAYIAGATNWPRLDQV